MKLVSTLRIEFIRELATEILGHYGRGRTIVAIDGTDAQERVAFADDLAAVFAEREHDAIRASLSGFGRSRAELSPFGPDTPERHYRHGTDYSALRRALIEPFRLGGSTGFVTQTFDAERDAWIEPTWLTAPADATLVIDGEFMHRPELRTLWSYGVLLEGTAQSEADRIYLADATPRERGSALVGLSAAAAPRRLFTDSC